MNGYVYLAMAIGAEVIATTALKATEGFTKLGPSLLVVAGYGIAFWGLSQVVKTIPLGWPMPSGPVWASCWCR